MRFFGIGMSVLVIVQRGVSLHGLYATVSIRAVCTVVALLLFKGFVAWTFICNL